ncbi:hypothetical protein ASPCADRAFT_179954 [Aspergillus carbonarius ITEM 5010]|uniref:Chitin-binding type-4 domain-containing protein n=1 Tax=Aspergillus carbonarius (strain ITEM 5010) TaxID=602072 RepID=A0A1R3R690_ASPC5|nr:hypothetical protein ASPCADRAFT_179954 [Aspergillus carbonarius ITEM 5010]
MKQAGSVLALAGLISLAQGHGFVTSPQARMPGSAMEAACGTQVYNNQEADNYGNVQGELQIASGQSDYDASACDIWLCKGYKYADNKDNVYSYTAGETVDFVVDIRAPHTGTANVSVVETSTNTVIGSPLIYWSVYASTATGVTKNETNFSVTIPEDLGDKCTEGGACVLQWWWNAASIDQTYESCIDFTVVLFVFVFHLGHQHRRCHGAYHHHCRCCHHPRHGQQHRSRFLQRPHHPGHQREGECHHRCCCCLQQRLGLDCVHPHRRYRRGAAHLGG